MRTVTFGAFGEPKDVLELEERPAPSPGRGQARLRLVLSPIHNHDLATIRGVYGIRPALPAVPGSEALGIVEELGPDVSGLAIGQRVVVVGAGVWAGSFLVPAASAVPVPAAIPDELACQLLAMPISVLMLFADLQVKPGSWIVQNAAGGAVGQLISRLGKDRGIHVLNIVRRQEAVDELRADGHEHVVATSDAGWARRARELVSGADVSHAIDSVGGRAADDLMKLLSPGGTLVSFGGLSGEPLLIDPGALLFKEATVKGFWATRRAQRTSPEEYRALVGELLRLAGTGRLKLGVESRFPLDRVNEAVVAAEKPGRRAKIAISG